MASVSTVDMYAISPATAKKAMLNMQKENNRLKSRVSDLELERLNLELRVRDLEKECGKLAQVVHGMLAEKQH